VISKSSRVVSQFLSGPFKEGKTLDLLRVKANKESCCTELSVGGEEKPALRNFLAPYESGGELQSVGGAKVVAFDSLHCEDVHGLGGQNYGPALTERSGQLSGFRPLVLMELSHAGKPRQGARDLDRRSPPYYYLAGFEKGNGCRSCLLANAERNQGTCIPKCRKKI
jgi:hypothetical protein